jgi:hypothetical protein
MEVRCAGRLAAYLLIELLGGGAVLAIYYPYGSCRIQAQVGRTKSWGRGLRSMTRGDTLLEKSGQEEGTPLSRLGDMLGDYDPQFQEPLARLWEAASLVLMVLAVWEVVRRLAVRLAV